MVKTSKKEILYICVPTLSFRVIFKINREYKDSQAFIYYDFLSFDIKILLKLSRIREKKLIKYLKRIFGFEIVKVQHGKNIDYSAVHLLSMERTTGLIDELIPQIQKSLEFKWLSGLIGDEPALSFFSKNFSNIALFPNLLTLNTCYNQLNNPDNFVTISPFFGSKKWIGIFQKQLEYANIIPFNERLLNPNLIGHVLYESLIPLFCFIKFTCKRGISLKKIKRKDYKLILEFIDPKRLNGSAYDADYFIDGNSVKKTDILFFLTNSQLKILKKDGYSLIQIKALFQSKNYSISILDKNHYSVNNIVYLIKHLFGLYKGILYDTDIKYIKVVNHAWKDYLDYLPLFDSLNAKSMIYYTFPNGHTGFRMNDGLITGLCRKSGIQSIGIQSRTIYATIYEHCFDCFDMYLSWGGAWENISPKRLKYVHEVKRVGCIYTEDLKSAANPEIVRKLRKDWLMGKRMLISVFDSDIGEKSHYTYEYARSLILNIGLLAKQYRNCSFIIKTKNPDKNQLYLQDSQINELFDEQNQNIQFLNRERNDYNNVLNASDIVIAIGYTTPGFEALTLGKRAIYFSLLGSGGQAFAVLPDLIATNFDELKKLFEKALMDYQEYASKYTNELRMLNHPTKTGIKQNIIKAIC